ncbi:transcription elongation regulator [Rhizoclosmatium hyalinum]|nr:transcription elongation regulator [Rhizoclosmatium hyalinum]
MDPLAPEIDFDPKVHNKPQPSRHERYSNSNTTTTTSGGGASGAVKRPPPPPPPPVRPPPPPPPIHAAWTQHTSPTGAFYYYNSVTRESSWVRPPGFNPPPMPLPLPPQPVPHLAQQQQSHSQVRDSVPESVTAGSESASQETAQQLQQQNQEQPVQETVIVPEAPKERAIAMKKLPNSDWAIVLTSFDHEYFINLKTKQVTWEMPDEIGELIGQIMAGGYEDEGDVPEQEDEEQVEEKEPPKKEFEELADHKEVVRVYESANSAAMQAQMAAFIKQRELEEKKIDADMARKRKTAGDEDASTDASKKPKPNSDEPPLTNAEKQEMFFDMLRELETSPFSTYEKQLPTFESDPRYLAIPAPKTRKLYFDLFCKQRAAEIQQARTAATPSDPSALAPKERFRALLQETLGSADWRTLQKLTAYDDFSRKWKKDARYTALSDDRDRKAVFKDFVARLKSSEGERKKAERKKLEEAFFELLKSVAGINEKSRWRDVQNEIEKDKRFLAVPTPIQREELFRQYLKTLSLDQLDEAERREKERKEKEEASLREREEAVRKQLESVTREVKKSQYLLKTGESVNLFKNLLIDLVKTHKATWRDSSEYIKSDPRFSQIRLPEHELDHIFSEHIEGVFQRRLAAFHNLINERTYITTPFSEVSDALLAEPQTTRLECSLEELSRHYTKYQHDRERTARTHLQQCLAENGFVRFHVKSAVGNAHVQAIEKGLKEAPDGDEWRLIGLDEIKSVLKEDKRYNDFECFASERERIVFSFVKGLIEEFRGEKGGARDMTVARNAVSVNGAGCTATGNVSIQFGTTASVLTPKKLPDMSGNLYVFGAPYGDVNLGGSSSDWTSATAPANPQLLTNIANRPAFDTANPSCSFAPYLNYITVLNGDSSTGLTALHVFDVAAKTWTVVLLTGTDIPSGSDFAATVDHDTNVIYAFSKGSIYRVGNADDLNLSKLATNSKLSLPWLANPIVTPQPFDGKGYKPVFGQGTNHLHFFNAPGLADGQAWIFVVHYAWWQPTPQSFGSFKSEPGQSVYIPGVDQSKAPSVFAYIPDSGSATYLVDTVSNTTTTISGFGKSGSTFRYSATSSNLVQLDTTTGSLKVLPVAGGTVSSGNGVVSLPTVTVKVTSAVVSTANAASGAVTTASALPGSTGGSGAKMNLFGVIGALAAAVSVQAIGCTVNGKLDPNTMLNALVVARNLYVFGAPYGDINLGGSSSDWVSATAPANPQLLTNIANRPAFDTANPTCSFAPYLNYITVLNGDSSTGLTALHVFDVTAKTWSVVPLTGVDIPSGSDVVATLDHDTNVIYAFSNGYIYRVGNADDLNLSKLATNPKLSLPWLPKPIVTPQPFDGTNYKAVFGQGTNHLHFFNAPGLADGQAWIFVVHYAWWQPTPQSFGSFKSEPGQTVYIPAVDQSKAPSVFAYIPDSGSATYLVDTVSNTTTTIAGFGKSGSTFRYSATSSNLVQLDTSTGSLKVLPVAGGSVSSGSGVASLPSATGIKKAPTATGTSGSGSATGVATTTKSGSAAMGVAGIISLLAALLI